MEKTMVKSRSAVYCLVILAASILALSISLFIIPHSLPLHIPDQEGMIHQNFSSTQNQTSGAGNQIRPLWNYTLGWQVGSVTLSGDGDYIAGVTRPLWNGTGFTRKERLFLFGGNGTFLWEYRPSGDSYISHAVFSTDGSHLATIADEGTYVSVFSRNGTRIWENEWFEGEGENIAVSGDGRFTAGGFWNSLDYFDNNGKTVWYWWAGSPLQPKGYDFTNIHVAMSADGSRIAAVSNDSRIYYFDQTGYLKWSNPTGTPLESVAMTPSGRFIVAAGRNGEIFYFNDTGTQLWNASPGRSPLSISVSDDGEYLMAGTADNEVDLLNRTGSILWKYPVSGPVTGVSLSRDGQRAVAGSDDHTVYCFQRNGTLVWNYVTGGNITSVAVSRDGKYIAAGSNDGDLYFFNGDGSNPQTDEEARDFSRMNRSLPPNIQKDVESLITTEQLSVTGWEVYPEMQEIDIMVSKIPDLSQRKRIDGSQIEDWTLYIVY